MYFVQVSRSAAAYRHETPSDLDSQANSCGGRPSLRLIWCLSDPGNNGGKGIPFRIKASEACSSHHALRKQVQREHNHRKYLLAARLLPKAEHETLS